MNFNKFGLIFFAKKVFAKFPLAFLVHLAWSEIRKDKKEGSSDACIIKFEFLKVQKMFFSFNSFALKYALADKARFEINP